jgi:hypothetical protein
MYSITAIVKEKRPLLQQCQNIFVYLKNCDFVLKSKVRKRPKNSRKVAEYLKKLK